MIKKILILSIILLLSFSMAGAVMWDLKEIITGKQMVPDDNNGAPWFADSSKLYFGTGQDAYWMYNPVMDKIYLNDTPIYFEEAVTFGAGLTSSDVTALEVNDTVHDSSIAALVIDVDANETRIISLEGNDTIHDTGISDLVIDVDANETRIISLEGNDTSQDSDISNALAWIALNETAIGTVASDLDANETRIISLEGNDTIHDADIVALEGYVPHLSTIGGGTPGNFTLTGVEAGDYLAGVAYFNATTGNVTTVTDLTSEFSIVDTNSLNQTYSGNSSLNGYLLVGWEDRTA